ncbi:MAG: formylglycine-generating enzyme family protein, partial [Chloroflexaceae bacterium]|nr:formylglycine-generating enzyme family protein [Chloroflexaceae bacterium]
MGAWDGESAPDEYPQHQVQVKEFFMGMTTITQAQWLEVG